MPNCEVKPRNIIFNLKISCEEKELTPYTVLKGVGSET